MNFDLVYDFLRDEHGVYVLVYMPLLLVFAGVLMLVSWVNKRRRGESTTVMHLAMGIILSLVCGWLFVDVYLYHKKEYSITRDVYLSGEYEVLEGRVSGMCIMPANGNRNEIVYIEGFRFEYSDYSYDYYGYKNAKVFGGAFEVGRYVKLWYFRRRGRNVILRLEVDAHENK